MGRSSMSTKDAVQTSPRGDARPPPGSVPPSASLASRSAAMCHSMAIGFDDGLGKSLRGFLWQVVPDAALDKSVLVPA